MQRGMDMFVLGIRFGGGCGWGISMGLRREYDRNALIYALPLLATANTDSAAAAIRECLQNDQITLCR